MLDMSAHYVTESMAGLVRAGSLMSSNEWSEVQANVILRNFLTC
jgi:hypothetical protein